MPGAAAGRKGLNEKIKEEMDRSGSLGMVLTEKEIDERVRVPSLLLSGAMFELISLLISHVDIKGC